MIFYIHGFLSSPTSAKAQQTAQYMGQHFPDTEILIPQVSSDPTKAIPMLEELFLKNQSVIKGVMGSSLGGYYATYFVEKYSVKSVLINPAVRPYQLFEAHIGPQTNPYTNEKFDIDQAFLTALLDIDTSDICRPECYWLLQQQGDEVLDYRQAVEKYRQCRKTVEPGGNHAFVGFERFLPEIAAFFELA